MTAGSADRIPGSAPRVAPAGQPGQLGLCQVEQGSHGLGLDLEHPTRWRRDPGPRRSGAPFGDRGAESLSWMDRRRSYEPVAPLVVDLVDAAT